MKPMKKLLALVLAVALAAVCLPLSAAAAGPVETIVVTTNLAAPVIGDSPADHDPKITVDTPGVQVNGGSCYWFDPKDYHQFSVFEAKEYKYYISLFAPRKDVIIADHVTMVVDGVSIPVDVSKFNAQDQDVYIGADYPQAFTAVENPPVYGSVTLDTGANPIYVGQTVRALLNGSLALEGASKIKYRWRMKENGDWRWVGNPLIGDNRFTVYTKAKGETFQAVVHVEGYSGYLYSPTFTVSTADPPDKRTVLVHGGQANKYAAYPGETVTIQADMKPGKSFAGWEVVSGGVTLGNPSNPMASFVLGDENVVLRANFITYNPFTDVPEGKYFTEAVLWAVGHEPQITSGTTPTTFSPDKPCTRAQAVTFLWRAAGEPEVAGGYPFTDVVPGSYYEKAVLWALNNHITSGTSVTAFSPDKPCSRGEIVTFLWRYAGQPAASSPDNPFADVPEGKYYSAAVLWAVNADPAITSGTTPTTFSPDKPCTRGQIVTFLYRACKE